MGVGVGVGRSRLSPTPHLQGGGVDRGLSPTTPTGGGGVEIITHLQPVGRRKGRSRRVGIGAWKRGR